MKLRPKILFLVIGILIVSFLALSLPLYWYTRSALEDELDKRLVTVARIVSTNVNRDLVTSLVKEPALPTVRSALEQQLSTFLPDEIEGIALYTLNGNQIAQRGKGESAPPQLSILLGMLSDFGSPARSSVSEVYELSDGTYFKAAATSVDLERDRLAIVVVWGGAEFMTLIDQLVGSISWIILLALVLAITLTVIFSRSLIHPVRQLSEYAKSIEKNIYAESVNLGRKDEFGDLNKSLSEMHEEIKQNELLNKQLLSGIAHEIKNPLGGIEIYAGLLEEELSKESNREDSGEEQSYLGKITKELRRLKQVVLEYLDYARPPRGNLQQLAVESVFEDVHRILLPVITQKEVKYTLSGMGEILADESKLRTVFVNLLKNSLEAVDEGGTIDVTIECKDGRVKVAVSDDGEGIPEENIEKVFQPYFTTRDKGYGLGLAIAKNIIHEMNGTIFAKSDEGKGTTFVLELPKA